MSLLSASKGSNYYKHVEKTYNFRIKSETGKSAIVLLTLKENIAVHSLAITFFVFNHHKSFNKIQEQC